MVTGNAVGIAAKDLAMRYTFSCVNYYVLSLLFACVFSQEKFKLDIDAGKSQSFNKLVYYNVSLFLLDTEGKAMGKKE